MLAGGAWSRLFAGNAGLDLPQLKVLGSVFRTEPLTGGPEITASGSVFAFRKRLDGGYSIARRNANTAELTPDHFRLLSDFFPRLLASRHEIRLRSRQSHLARTAHRTALVAGSNNAVRGGPRTRSETETRHPGGSPRGAVPHFPCLRQHASRGILGRSDGRYPRRRPGDRRSQTHPRLFHRHRLFRPWLRDRPRSGKADGGSGGRGSRRWSIQNPSVWTASRAHADDVLVQAAMPNAACSRSFALSGAPPGSP